jgi:hypothetical protein
VTGLLPEDAIKHHRCFDFLIAMLGEQIAHVLFDALPDDPTVRMPEHHARRFFLQMEQVELSSQFAMIAFFRLFQHVQIGIKLFLLGPGCTVDAL